MLTPKFRLSKKKNNSTKASSSRYYIVPILGLLLLVLGLFLIRIIITPVIERKTLSQVTQAADEAIGPDRDMIFIPTVGLQAQIATGGIDTLDKGLAWHRLPEQGDPVRGGNMIITGHNFIWSLDSKKVLENSIFYNLNKIKVGDAILINWHGARYEYVARTVKTVKPTDTSVESQTPQPTLTIYTCTYGGFTDGRVVVVATPKAIEKSKTP